ncbi:MAG TPA: glyceraldehyde-3-phosphate dehydrogenase [Flavobacteriales bacterium]|nr:glyceraldehyde-3-phosphate dehydrogenase [Flavobacteriales bacterium]
MSTVATTQQYESLLKDYIAQEKAAVDIISAVGHLMFEKSVELVLFRNPLVDVTVSHILNLHRYAQDVVKKPIDLKDTAELARALMNIPDLAPSKIDIGRLTREWVTEKANFKSKDDFLKNKLANYIGKPESKLIPRDVVLFGFGRIGRIAARELVKQAGKGQQLRLRAIVSRGVSDKDIVKRAALMRRDSVHGTFPGTIVEDLANKALIINGQTVKMIEASNPQDVDYTQYGINDALLIDNTGVYKERATLQAHLQAKGISKVLLTAPGKEVPNIVYGVNHKTLDIENETIYSAASCTTNAIATVLSVIEQKLGVEKGHVETVHAYSNDQNLLDNMHKSSRRGRSAAINMVITETGAGKAVTKCIPSLKDKLTANAVRVPIPNGSLAVLSLTLNKTVTRDEINDLIKDAALNSELVNQINYSIDPELVSSDIVGNSCCSVFDSNATIVSVDGKNCVLYVWYDNEFGYTKQVLRLAKYITKVSRLVYY